MDLTKKARVLENPHGRDISEYKVNEAAPTEKDVRDIFNQLLALAKSRPDTLTTLRNYIRKWASWLKLGLSSIKEFEKSVQILLPSIFSCRMPSAEAVTSAYCL
jgi:hypothetical protein